MAELNSQHRDFAPADRSASVRYAVTGHPSVDRLMAGQGTGPITDGSVLHGHFWPEEESIEDFWTPSMSGAATSGLTPPHDANRR